MNKHQPIFDFFEAQGLACIEYTVGTKALFVTKHTPRYMRITPERVSITNEHGHYMKINDLPLNEQIQIENMQDILKDEQKKEGIK